MNYKFYLLLFFGLLYIGCAEQEQEKSEHKKKESAFNNLYEQSEMAVVMVDMYEFLEENRKRILASEPMEELPEFFDKLHTAEMGEDYNRDAIFKGYSDTFITNVTLLHSSENTDKVKLFNNTVNSCVACHTSGASCMGPIPRINKLLIKTGN